MMEKKVLDPARMDVVIAFFLLGLARSTACMRLFFAISVVVVMPA